MSSDKSRLLENLKKTLAVGLPVMAISGFAPTAMTVGTAMAEGKNKEVVAEAKSEAESKYAGAKSEAKSEAESKYAGAKSEAKAEAESETKAEAESEAKAEAESKKGS